MLFLGGITVGQVFLVISGSVALAGMHWSIHVLEGISAKPPLT